MRNLSLFILLTGAFAALTAQTPKLNERMLGAIEARHIGPATMSGRVTSIAAQADDPQVLYVGAAAGGVWKSKNGGTTFKPVFDKHPQSIGAIAIDPQQPQSVWVGTGEPWTRNSTSVGKGVYKSTDGGENWKALGLEKTERIAHIALHPQNSDIAYVAAMGGLWHANPERGVYKTSDGGKSWERALFVDENTGCASLCLDPQNPDIVYAAMWDYRRTPYSFRSGGPGSGLYKSNDGGKSWKKLEKGLPEGTLGRICVTASPVKPYAVFALVEAEKSALYRSKDQGESWEKLSDSGIMGERPFYFSLIVPDPLDSLRVYKPGTNLSVSSDGGKTFGSPSIDGGSYHSDVHAVCISPLDNRIIYLGTDGGVYRSMDRGNTWNHLRNLPLSQFYHVSADMKKPYQVYGGLQDNGSWVGPSSSAGGISNADWESVGFGDGFVVLPDPIDDNILYWESQGGNIARYYRDNGELKFIRPFAESSANRLRFNWNTPIYFGHGPQPALYVGAQFLFRSSDRGDSWQRISPDLSTDDPEKQKQEESGGLTIDNSTAENHCSIVTIAESPFDAKVIWAGTDDGNLQLSDDGGASWRNVSANLPGAPKGAWVSCVEAGRHDRNTAFVTLDGHRNGDMRPYVFKTTDLGKSWTALTTADIDGFCHVIRQDLQNPQLLFLGTEFGLFLSIDGGAQWVRFSGNMPQTPVFALYIHPRDQDLIIGTHGRGIMILDDLTPLRQLSPEVTQQEVAFLDSRPFVLRPVRQVQKFPGDDEFSGKNPPSNAVITYYFKDRHVFGDLFLEVLNEKGELIKKLPASGRKGINRVDLLIRKRAPNVPRSQSLAFQAAFGPPLPAGTYTARLTKGDNTYTRQFTLLDDPDSRHSAADRQANAEALNRAYDLLESMAFTARQVNDIMKQSRSKADSVKNAKLATQLRDISTRMEARIQSMMSTSRSRIAGQVRIREQLAEVYSALSGYQGRPTQSQLDKLAALDKEISGIQQEVDGLLSGELLKVNAQLAKLRLRPIESVSREAFEREMEQQASGLMFNELLPALGAVRLR